MKAYRVKFLEKKDYSTAGLIKVGDEVIVYGNITKYNEVNQIASGGYIYSLNGVTTNINKITADKAIDANAPMYNLAGQEVTKSYKGIVIKNGKKVVIK
jgi:hypothetical protein